MMHGSSGSHAEQVLSAACRGMLSVLAAVAAEGSGQQMQTRMQLAEASSALENAAAIARLQQVSPRL